MVLKYKFMDWSKEIFISLDKMKNKQGSEVCIKPNVFNL